MSCDLSLPTITKIFEKQIMDLTTRTSKLRRERNLASFDIQFSDRWLK